MQLLPFQLVIHIFGFLGQTDGIQVDVAVENSRATSESSGKGAGKTAQEQVLTCDRRMQSSKTVIKYF